MKKDIIFKVIYMSIMLIVLFSSITFAKDENDTIEETMDSNMLLTNEQGIDVEYKYDDETNQVTAIMTSAVELQDTKPTWDLSEDKKTYTKVFTENQTYSTDVVDINGTIISVEINITQIKETVITMTYNYDERTNQVTAIMTSNVELQDTKPTWDLSEDKKTYTKVFTENQTYSTDVVDINGTVISVEVNITQIKETIITISYDYNEETNQVTAIITSNIELQDTKPTWNFGDDKKTYTKVYTENQTYSTDVVDVNGRVTSIEIDITQIIETVITMSYEYDDETNQVTAIMTSTVELQDTKPTWELSADKKTYTKVFTENQSYSTEVLNKYGQVINIQIDIIDVDETAPILTLEYKYNPDDTVTVTMKSNERLKDTKPSWTLSADGCTYTKTYTEANQSYGTEVYDAHGIGTIIKIEYKTKKYVYNQKDNSTITVKYLYANETVTVDIISSIQMQKTKPTWTLSSDGYTYTKTFTENNNYRTDIVDVNGNVKTVDILVNFFETKTRYDGVDVSFYQKYILWDKVKQAGIDFAMIRAGFRGYGASGSMNIDPYFETNLKNAALNGMNIGIYFYSQAITVQEAVVEANFVLDLLKKYNIEIKYPIAIDTERTPNGTGRADSISKELRTEICKTFCDVIEQAGYKSMIYANKDWLLNNLNINELNDYDIWLAHYTNETDYPYAYTMWQYTSSGIVNGIAGYVDMNYCYKKY